MAPLIQYVDTETSCVESSSPIQPIKVPLVSSAAPKPSISFNSNVLVNLTIHIEEYSDEEIAATWYSQHELTRSRSELTSTLLLMANGNAMANSERLCSRGLECLTSEGRAIKKQATATVVGFFDQEAVRQQSLPSLPIKISRKVGLSRSSSISCFDLESIKPRKILSRAA
jgi:hypothetical protein